MSINSLVSAKRKRQKAKGGKSSLLCAGKTCRFEVQGVPLREDHKEALSLLLGVSPSECSSCELSKALDGFLASDSEAYKEVLRVLEIKESAFKDLVSTPVVEGARCIKTKGFITKVCLDYTCPAWVRNEHYANCSQVFRLVVGNSEEPLSDKDMSDLLCVSEEALVSMFEELKNEILVFSDPVD